MQSEISISNSNTLQQKAHNSRATLAPKAQYCAFDMVFSMCGIEEHSKKKAKSQKLNHVWYTIYVLSRFSVKYLLCRSFRNCSVASSSICLFVCLFGRGMHVPGHMSTSYNATCWKLVLGFYLFRRQGGSVLHDIGHLTLKLRAGPLISTSHLKEQCAKYRSCHHIQLFTQIPQIAIRLFDFHSSVLSAGLFLWPPQGPWRTV